MHNQKRSAGAGSSGVRPPPSKRRANGDDEVDLVLDGTAAAESYAKAWRRPDLPPLNPETDGIDFQQLEADWEVCDVAAVLPEFSTPGVKEERAAAIRFYGVTKAGNAVMVHVHGFMPYFYVRAWPGFKPEDCEPFRERLNGRLRGASKDQARR